MYKVIVQGYENHKRGEHIYSDFDEALKFKKEAEGWDYVSEVIFQMQLMVWKTIDVGDV